MNSMYDAIREKAHRFTPSEIQAEILRQQIQELGQREIEEYNDPQIQADTQKLEGLKLRLADIEEPAQLHAQGRLLMRKYLNWMEKIEESGGVLADADEMLDDCRKWMDAVDDEQRRRHLRHMSSFKRTWPVADWERRGKMLRWLGRHSLQRFANEKPRYHIGRVLVGWATTMAKKRW